MQDSDIFPEGKYKKEAQSTSRHNKIFRSHYNLSTLLTRKKNSVTECFLLKPTRG